MIRIDCYINNSTKENLQKHSYKGKKKDQKQGELTFSEHLRKAIKEYNERLGK